MPAQTSNCVVAYLDILGYVDGVKEAIGTHRSALLLRNLREAFDKAIEAVHAIEQDTKQTVSIKAFSDNIALSICIGGDAEEELLAVIRAVAAFQSRLVLAGFAIRGAISIGEHYMDGEIIFGEAILEAYAEESNRALNPRVILAPSAFSNVQRHMEKYEERGNKAPQAVFLLADSDGKFFVNYLEALVAKSSFTPSDEDLLAHSKFIERSLRRFADFPAIRTKYVWAAQFHNSCCGRWGSSLTVAEDLISAAPQPIQ